MGAWSPLKLWKLCFLCLKLRHIFVRFFAVDGIALLVPALFPRSGDLHLQNVLVAERRQWLVG